MKEVIIYSTGACPYCVAAKQLLQSKGVPFKEVRIDLNPDERDIMLEKAKGRRTVPQIFVGDTHVGGFDDLNALNQAGKLDTLLQS